MFISKKELSIIKEQLNLLAGVVVKQQSLVSKLFDRIKLLETHLGIEYLKKIESKEGYRKIKGRKVKLNK
jgi:hypothetical protein